MPRNGSGSYSAPANSVNPAVATTTIDDSDFNDLVADLESAMTASIANDGQTTTTAVIPFASGVKSDTIVENTSNTGVTVDGTLVKDGTINVTQTNDANGNETLILGTVASAVNEITVTNSATGNAPSIAVTGDDTNIDLPLVPKGTGQLDIGSGGATQAEQEAGTATDKIVTPGRQHFHPSAAKAWAEVINADTTPALDESYNVTSATDVAAGRMQVNWAENFSGTSYSPQCLPGENSAGTAPRVSMYDDNSKTAGATEFQFFSVTGNLSDPDAYSVVAFGDHA